MFVVKFWGGLGNQMFEYALLKQLEKHYPQNSIRGYIPNPPSKKYSLFQYWLEKAFNIHIKECTWKTVTKLSDLYPENGPAHTILRPLSKLTSSVLGHKTTHIYQDDFTCFYPEVYNLNPLYSYYFEGAWANYEYLIGIEDILFNDFKFSNELSEDNRIYQEKIITENSVSIHVRRGDFVKCGYSLTTEKYYKRAIHYINERVQNPVYYVFSNDHKYCQELFDDKIKYTMVTGNDGKDSFRDMQLMSLCKHNIIANSTFSFWGAYLNKNPYKIVVSPNLGVGVTDHSIPFSCPEWIKIDV